MIKTIEIVFQTNGFADTSIETSLIAILQYADYIYISDDHLLGSESPELEMSY